MIMYINKQQRDKMFAELRRKGEPETLERLAEIWSDAIGATTTVEMYDDMLKT